MSTFTRSARWRQAFFAACLPFIFVSVFVESLHTAPGRDGGTFAPAAIMAANAGLPSVQAGGSDESCPACNWLRLGRRIENPVALVRTADIVLADTPPQLALFPASPVPHPALFRGPPRPVLS